VTGMESAPRQFPCSLCGAAMEWRPGARTLACPYCRGQSEVPADDPGAAAELDYAQYLATIAGTEAATEQLTVACQSCAATVVWDANVTSELCPFCGAAVAAGRQSVKVIKPKSLLPFSVDGAAARAAFTKWVKSRWFAPSQLKSFARLGRLNGVYLPFWTYDSATTTRYTGERGEHYYVSENYSTTENGRSVTRTRQVQRTRWHSASGTVSNAFDDVLVAGSASVPERLLDALAPWDLSALAPYAEEYLAGFRSESYTVALEAGFEAAKRKMEPVIEQTIRRDIGGDEQRIQQKDTGYRAITFKHILLPVWICAYRFRTKTYRIVVNARTGELQGERPYSWIKITLAVLGAIAAVAAAFLVFGG